MKPMNTMIELIEAAEDAAEALEPAEQSLDLVAASYSALLDSPRLHPQWKGRHHGNEAQIERELRVSLPSYAQSINRRQQSGRPRSLPWIELHTAHDPPAHRRPARERARTRWRIEHSAATI